MTISTKILATRCYCYALQPSPAQVEALDQATTRLRLFWNELVALERYAVREWKNGRRATLRREYAELLLAKKCVGVAAGQAKKQAQIDGTTPELALRTLRLARAEKSSRLIRTKNNRPLRRLSQRQFAVEYAIERACANAQLKHGAILPGAWALVAKFKDCSQLYVQGKRGQPKFKNRLNSVALQVQITRTYELAEKTVDLSYFGHQSLTHVPLILHRPIPKDAKVKQLAVTQRGDRHYVIFMVEADAAVFALPYPETKQIAGIDPGRKTALSISSLDGTRTESITPKLMRSGRFLKKMAKKLRKVDRQRRANNPECFNQDGTWKRGFRASKVSRNMRQTHLDLLKMQQHLANARKETYHLAAHELLRNYDRIGVGTWRGRGNAPGQGKARQGQNRKDYDNAISLFTSILTDKAKRSIQPKFVVPIHEAGTTKTCNACGQPTGPSGLEQLNVRWWTCSSCQAVHQRDFASARAIAQKVETAAAAHTAQPVAQPRNQRRRPKGQTKGVAPATQVPVADEAHRREAGLTIKSLDASAAVKVQAQGCPRTSQGHVAQKVAKLAVSSPPSTVLTVDDRSRLLHLPSTGERLVSTLSQSLCAET